MEDPVGAHADHDTPITLARETDSTSNRLMSSAPHASTSLVLVNIVRPTTITRLRRSRRRLFEHSLDITCHPAHHLRPVTAF